jgi:hypothetical protein
MDRSRQSAELARVCHCSAGDGGLHVGECLIILSCFFQVAVPFVRARGRHSRFWKSPVAVRV